MKRLLFLLFCLESILIMFADDGNPAAINLQHNGPGNHSGIPLPADMPDVYYDGDNQQIIVDGLGVVNYYDVEIASATNWTVYISTQVSGSYGTIDISSLPQASTSSPSTAHWTTPTKDTLTPINMLTSLISALENRRLLFRINVINNIFILNQLRI